MKTLHRSLLAVLLLAAFALAGGTHRAQAQVSTNCCGFTLLLSNMFPCAVPFTVRMSWDGTIQPYVMTVKGAQVPFAIPNCPPTPHVLDSIQVGGTWVVPTMPLPYTSGPINICGGCTRVGISLNATTGCLEIRLTGTC